MPETMLAVVKPEAAPAADVRQMPRPQIGPDDVLVKVKVASVCGTDLHIYNWDNWAQNRIKPPLIPGHEFCGHVTAVGKNVTTVKEGDFVSAEMHVACGKCYQCRTGEAHICQHVKIIGVDVMLEMSGKSDAIRLGFKILRLGGRVSLLGIPSKPVEFNLADDFIFKGAVVQGINGRLMYKTWYQMNALLKAGKLDLGPAITDRMAMADFDKGMERLQTGAASKILLYPNGTERI